jgi:hypothetical protein
MCLTCVVLASAAAAAVVMMSFVFVDGTILFDSS